MKPYTELELQRALRDIDTHCSIRQAARNWGIPYHTLRHRFHGMQSKNTAYSHMQRLSQSQEQYLAEWVYIQDALGVAPTHQQLKGLAERMMGSINQPLGKRWVNRFLRRNPSIGTRRSRAIDARRWKAHSSEVIEDFFHRLDSIPTIQGINPSNRWNMDETGIMEGKGANGLVLGSMASQHIQKKQPGSRTWVSIIECVAADGRSLCPLVIYKGKSVQAQWFPSNLFGYEGWHFTYTDNGWTTEKTALEWLKKVFIPGTMPSEPEAARLLVLDGHYSHISTDFMWECFQNKIYLLYLPPHSSAVLQPLDVAVFSPLKQAYRKEVGYLDDWVTDSTVAGKRAFLECYFKARKASITSQNIKSGWRASGLWPVSIRRPLSNPMVSKAQETSQQTNQPSSQQWDEAISIALWSTPHRSADLRRQLHLFNQLGKDGLDTHTIRHLSRKVQKGYDEQASRVVHLEQQVRQLEGQLEEQQQRKRKKVRLSPNRTFANIWDIQRAQGLDIGDIGSPDESRASELSSEAGSCIWVGGRDSEMGGDSGGDDESSVLRPANSTPSQQPLTLVEDEGKHPKACSHHRGSAIPPQVICLRTDFTAEEVRTEALHKMPGGTVVSTCSLDPQADAKRVLRMARFTRTLRTTESRAAIRRIMGEIKSSDKKTDSVLGVENWVNGQDNVWLTGAWCWDGMVLLEGCLVSAMRIANDFDVKVPWTQ
ncbi:transposase [Colletotrichum tabaci]|uniref:Transposase n=1 Tax=Colletotrichum tabaci TaxID=1209068 RepID=A0AAV9TPK6_9PEZI